MSCLYLFLDEGGDLNFSRTGSCYFTFASVSMLRDFSSYSDLDSYKYDLIEFGQDRQRFHCSEDNARVKDRVFGIIQAHLASIKIDSIVVRKCKTGTALQEPSEFYGRMLGYLIQYILNGRDLRQIDEVIVITDNLPMKRKREAFQKAIKKNLTAMLPAGTSYRILHHGSCAHYGLQIADYCNWAIFKKWESGVRVHYDTIRPAIRSEFDIFRTGTRKYYEDGRPL